MNRRELKGFWSVSAVALAVLVPFASIVYVLQILPDLGIIVYKEQFLALFLALCVAITFLILPPRENVAETSGVPWYDVICALAALAVGGYIFFNYGDLVGSLGIITTDKVIASAIGTLLLFEATRRQAGWSMVTVGLVALAYAYFGHFLSGMFETRVIRWDRLLTYNYLGAGAIFGTPLYVAATIVTSFVLFGQILFLIGGGDAKVAILSSALFGSLSGSASANVATTGILTIPMMRRVGYSAEKSAAVEAVASTGGLILPPVMAATGFLMAEFLGIPYSSVAIAAALPALLFYFCLYLQVDFEAAKDGVTGAQAGDLPNLRKSLRGIVPVILPFAVLLYTLFALYWSPAAAAFAGTFATFILSVAIAKMRNGLGGYIDVLAKAGEATVFVAIMCAMAGLVVGCLGLTGLGSSLSQHLVAIAGGNIWLLLLFAAFGCIILGMGVPVTATYIILVILIGPALVQVGIDKLAGHMFVFYFGTLSFLTPPVCLAVFVAASIAGSKPMISAVHALRYAIVAYIIPFAFVFNEAYLFQGPWQQIAEAVVAGIVGVILISAGLVGYFRAPLSMPVRVVVIAGGLATVFLVGQHWAFGAAGVVLLLLLFGLQRTAAVPARLENPVEAE